MIASLFTLVLLNFSVLVSASSSDSKAYCAVVNSDYDTSTTLGSVKGSFKMVIDNENSMGQYTYYFNLANFSVVDQTCDLSKGLTYHVHSNWANADESITSSLGGTDCGAAYTGFHFDPTFACSETSENHATGTGYNTDYCQAMSRTSALGYVYKCNVTNYAEARDYSKCELGDLSAKLGPALPTTSTSKIYSQSKALVDYIPVYNHNFEYTDQGTKPTTAYAWSSLVVHCKSTGARIFCAKFQSISSDDNSCGTDPDIVITNKPTYKPTHKPTRKPTHKPTRKPTHKPTRKPTHKPTA